MTRRIALVYALVVAVLFSPFFLWGEVFVPADFLSFIYPWRAYQDGFPHNIELFDVAVFFFPQDLFLNENLKAGVIPLWNPHIFSGHPAIASGQSGILYPPRLLLHFLFSAGVAKTWIQLLHLLGMGLGMHWFLRVRGFHTFPAFVGGLAWMANSHVTGWMEFEHVGVAGMYLPLLLVSLEKALAGRAIAWLGIPVLGALSLHSGHLQSNLYTGTLFGVYALVRLAQERELGHWLRFAGVSLLTVGLAGPTVFPFLSFLSESQRLPLDPAANASDLGSLVLSMLCPDLFGNPTKGFMVNRCQANLIYPEFACFAGTIPLIFFLSAKGRQARVIQAISVLCLLVASAPFGLALPLLGRFIPGRVLLFLMFCVAYGAAIGAQQFERSQERARKGAMLVGGLWILILAGIFYLLSQPDLVLEWWQANPRSVKLPPLNVGQEAFWEAFQDTYAWNLQLWFPVAAVVCLIWAPRKAVLVGLTALELVWFASGFNTSVPNRELTPSTPEIAAMAASEGRVLSIACANYNTLTPYGLSLVNGYESLVPRRYQFLLSQAEPERPLPMRSLALSRIDSPILDALSLEYVLLPPHQELTAPGWETVFSEKGGHVLRNQESLPRVSLLGQVRPLQEPAQLRTLEPRKYAFVSQAPPPELAPGKGRVKWVAETPNTLTLSVEAETTQLLLLTDSYFEGWECTIDGSPTTIFPANIGSRGVYVSQGRHRVVFQFRPSSLSWGLGTALGSLLIVLGLAGFLGFREKVPEVELEQEREDV